MKSMRLRIASSIVLAATVVLLLVLTGCAAVPATIVGSVSFLNYPQRTFPPAGYAGAITPNVAYVRLMDADGAGAALWQSPAYPVGALVNSATSDEGEFLDSFVITLSDAQISAATMPLRLEAFLFGQEAVGALNPASVDRYSTYDAGAGEDIGWYYSFTIGSGEIKVADLSVRIRY